MSNTGFHLNWLIFTSICLYLNRFYLWYRTMLVANTVPISQWRTVMQAIEALATPNIKN